MNRINLVALAILAVAASTPIGATPENPTFHDCELLANYGKIVLVAYCPAATPPAEVAQLVLATRGIWMSRHHVVIYAIYSTKVDVPKNFAESMQKSDAWVAKNEIGHALFNSSTGVSDFNCKKDPKGKLVDCRDLLK